MNLDDHLDTANCITKHLSKHQLEYYYFVIERLSLWTGQTH